MSHAVLGYGFCDDIIYNRGLKLKSIGGPYSQEKCSSGHSLLEKAFEGRKLIFPL